MNGSGGCVHRIDGVAAKKVYCKDCKWLHSWGGISSGDECRCPSNMADTPIARKPGDPYQLNKKNDCLHYEAK